MHAAAAGDKPSRRALAGLQRSGERARHFDSGQVYLTHFALPNFYFHVTTAYAILRHNGAPIGKKYFIGSY